MDAELLRNKINMDLSIMYNFYSNDLLWEDRSLNYLKNKRKFEQNTCLAWEERSVT